MISEKDAHISYSVSIYNTAEDRFPINASYQGNRNMLILNEPPINYHCVITRLSIPMSAIPISYWNVDTSFIPNPLDPIQKQINDQINAGVWKIKIFNTITSQTFTRNVMLIPAIYQNPYSPTPKTPQNNGGKQDQSRYYWIYSYNLICEMINQTFVDLYKDAGLTTTKYSIPFFSFADGRFTLNIPTNFLISGSPSYNGWGDIYFNFALLGQCLGALPYISTPVVEFFKLRIPDITTTQYNPMYFPFEQITYYDSAGTASTVKVLKMVQQFVYSPQYLSFINQIIITSSGLKCRKKLISSNLTSNTSQTAPIIFSFKPDINQAGVVQDVLNYYNTNWNTNNILDLQGGDYLYSFDLQLSISDNLGNIWAIPLEYGQVVDIQFEFIKKKI